MNNFETSTAEIMTIEKLINSIEPRLTEIEEEMARPEIASDQNRMKALARERKRISKLLKSRDRLIGIRLEIAENREALEDPELAELATEELSNLELELSALESSIHRLLVPEDPIDSRNAVLEIRAGTGGDEASLFGTDLYKMYTHYFEGQNWTWKILSANFSDLGGVKELIMVVSGEGAYGSLKYESGVHRVQRVPTTETSGRLHTSAATVAVLPEAAEVDVQIDPKDIKIDTFRSSGPGGQHVNKTDSAIRITHKPTGMVVTCQDEKSQLKNKVQALKVLRSRLYKLALDKEQSKRAQERKSQVSTGDRSAKIRTYNFPQNRVTDHRVSVSIHRLDEILAGNLDLIMEPLKEHLSSQKLEELMKAGV